MWSCRDILLPPNTQRIVASVCAGPIVWDAWQRSTKLIPVFEACLAGWNCPPPTYRCFQCRTGEALCLHPTGQLSPITFRTVTDTGKVFLSPSGRVFNPALCCEKCPWIVFLCLHSFETLIVSFEFQGNKMNCDRKQSASTSTMLFLLSIFYYYLLTLMIKRK